VVSKLDSRLQGGYGELHINFVRSPSQKMYTLVEDEEYTLSLRTLIKIEEVYQGSKKNLSDRASISQTG
jgi:hypothetical protein